MIKGTRAGWPVGTLRPCRRIYGDQRILTMVLGGVAGASQLGRNRTVTRPCFGNVL